LRKIILLCLIAGITGCSGIRRIGKGGEEFKKDDIALVDVINQNLSKESFYIQKANIEYENGNTTVSFIATVKYVIPDEYLISLRLKSGIEIARIYMNPDTIMANDRINKRFYYGKPDFLSARYGVPLEVLPVIFGDLITTDETKNLKFKCMEGKMLIDSYVKGLKIEYEVDCTKRKSIVLRQEGSYSGTSAEITYNKFEKQGNTMIPGEIIIYHKESGSNLKLRVEKVETPWKGSIEFIPGIRYEKMELR